MKKYPVLGLVAWVGALLALGGLFALDAPTWIKGIGATALGLYVGGAGMLYWTSLRTAFVRQRKLGMTRPQATQHALRSLCKPAQPSKARNTPV